MPQIHEAQLQSVNQGIDWDYLPTNLTRGVQRSNLNAFIENAYKLNLLDIIRQYDLVANPSKVFLRARDTIIKTIEFAFANYQTFISPTNTLERGVKKIYICIDPTLIKKEILKLALETAVSEANAIKISENYRDEQNWITDSVGNNFIGSAIVVRQSSTVQKIKILFISPEKAVSFANANNVRNVETQRTIFFDYFVPSAIQLYAKHLVDNQDIEPFFNSNFRPMTEREESFVRVRGRAETEIPYDYSAIFEIAYKLFVEQTPGLSEDSLTNHMLWMVRQDIPSARCIPENEMRIAYASLIRLIERIEATPRGVLDEESYTFKDNILYILRELKNFFHEDYEDIILRESFYELNASRMIRYHLSVQVQTQARTI